MSPAVRTLSAAWAGVRDRSRTRVTRMLNVRSILIPFACVETTAAQFSRQDRLGAGDDHAVGHGQIGREPVARDIRLPDRAAHEFVVPGLLVEPCLAFVPQDRLRRYFNPGSDLV